METGSLLPDWQLWELSMWKSEATRDHLPGCPGKPNQPQVTICSVTHANTKKMRWKQQQVSHETLNLVNKCWPSMGHMVLFWVRDTEEQTRKMYCLPLESSVSKELLNAWHLGVICIHEENVFSNISTSQSCSSFGAIWLILANAWRVSVIFHFGVWHLTILSLSHLSVFLLLQHWRL